ncbi:hypothetical protein BH11MYX4_BH11MYX4_24330 [soil metagenome]
MIRFNIARNLLVLAALVMGGCAAQSSSPGGDVGHSEDELNHTELVALDGNGSPILPNTERTFGKPTPVGGEANGPQPEPWNGVDDPNGSPQPEPWRPKKIAPEPDPASAAPIKP